jgi:hypothetical protein
MEILSPVWPDRGPSGPAPKRPRTLDGVTLALVDDNLDAALTTHLEALLAERAGAKVRRWVKPSGTAPSPSALLDEAAREAAAAVVGVGL